MARPLLDLPDRPASCPKHPGSKIYADRPTRRWSPFHESRSFRCVPEDKAERHLMTPSLVSRGMSAGHPKAGLPCPHCGSSALDNHGPVCVSGFTFAGSEIAQTILNAGKGESYAEVSADIRRGARRSRQAGRGRRVAREAGETLRPKKMEPRKPAPSRTPRPLVDPKVYRGKRLADVPRRKAYNYSRPKPVETLFVNPSRTGNLAQSYIDVFAPVILDAFKVTEWPEIVVIDSLPIKRRRIEKNSRGKIVKISNGESAGEVYAAADGSTTPGSPILAGLEGGSDSTSVKRFLGRLATVKEPVWVVADLHDGIALAVKEVWPNAVLYRCEEHLHLAMRKALEKDGIGPWVEIGDEDATPADAKGVKRDGEFIEHILYYRLRAALWSEARWRAFSDAVEAIVPETHNNTRTWIADRTALVLDQIELRKRFKGYPRSTGAIEGTIKRIKAVVAGRSEYYRNAARLDKLVNLVRLDAIGAADLDTYTSLITKHLLARDGAGLDWQSGRDPLGTSSIDDLIETAKNEHSAFIEARRKQQRLERIAARTAEVNEALAAQGLPPVGRVRDNGPLDPIYIMPRTGRTIADYPELLGQYEPARNNGKPAVAFTAASGKPVTWVCRAHREADGSGHDHVWSAPPVSRTAGSKCPVCAGRQPCAKNSLRGRNPGLAAEWYQPLNGTLTPDDVTPGMPRSVYWKCREDPAHEPYPKSIWRRTYEHKGCPSCVRERQAARARKVVRDTAQDQRERARAQRPLTVPPVLDVAVLALSVAEPTSSIREVAVALGRSDQTVRNWIRGGRLRAEPPSAPNLGYRIPSSEIERVRTLLGVARDGKAA